MAYARITYRAVINILVQTGKLSADKAMEVADAVFDLLEKEKPVLQTPQVLNNIGSDRVDENHVVKVKETDNKNKTVLTVHSSLTGGKPTPQKVVKPQGCGYVNKKGEFVPTWKKLTTLDPFKDNGK